MNRAKVHARLMELHSVAQRAIAAEDSRRDTTRQERLRKPLCINILRGASDLWRVTSQETAPALLAVLQRIEVLKRGQRAANMAGARRFVVTGPAGCGKSTWVQAHARRWDLVWDLDQIASTVSCHGQEVPRGQRGNLPWPTMKAVLVMRDALVAWLTATTLHTAEVYVIVTDERDAARIARQIGATVVRP